MAAEIRRLHSRPDRLRADEGSRLREALLPFMDDMTARPELDRVVSKLLAVVDRETASRNRWTFVMLSPAQNGIVVNYLARHAARPLVSLRLWALCFEHLRTDTGEVVLSRDEIAQALDVPAREVSRCMSELVGFGALSRRRERVAGMRGPGVVRYFMNPNVATSLSGKARDDAQRAAPILKLIDGTSHPSQRRARAAAVPLPVL